MASNYTENYGLCQWEATDQVLREEFNQDNEKIDAALGELAALEAKIPTFINGSYVGTGKAGKGNPCTLHFGFPPKMVFLNTQTMSSDNSIGKYIILFPGMTDFPIPDLNNRNTLTWLEDGISWYYAADDDTQQVRAYRQYNTSGKTYNYVAATW